MNLVPSLTTRTLSVVTASLLLPCMGAVWLMLRPHTVTGSTYAVFATLILATGAIVINTWHNAQATSSTGHLLYATETAGASKL